MQKSDDKDPTRMPFTDLGIRRLNIDNQLKRIAQHTGRKNLKQALIWDEGCRGLCLLISAGGTKTFRCLFKLHGKWITHTLGRYGEMVLDADPNHEGLQVGEARRLTSDYRAKALKGIDPRQASSVAATGKVTYGYVADQFIRHYAQPKQRTWDQTERVLKVTCAKFLKRPIEGIGKQEVRAFLREFVTAGHPYKAAVTYTWLRKLFRWANEEDYLTSSIMEGVKIEWERRTRTRTYSADEVKAIWQAASTLSPIDISAYFKLLLLLAPRKTALALMQWSDLNHPDNPTLWITPHELTKTGKAAKPRVYRTPLPALAQRVLKGLPRTHVRVFPNLPLLHRPSGLPMLKDEALVKELKRQGAPEDFYPHAIRHTIATFLENAGHNLWERGLVLNHAEQGTTAGYSHGDPRDRKLELLEKWAAHIEGLLQPMGARVLR